MPNKLLIEFPSDGRKNVIIKVSGFLMETLEWTDVLTFEKLAEAPKKLKVQSVIYMIQEKMGLYLWWRLGEKIYSPIFPLESRGKVDFDGMQGVNSPEGAVGISISSFNQIEVPKAFLLMLDMDKQ